MAITYNFYIILDTYKHKPLKCAQNVIPPRLSTTKCIFKSALPSTVIIVFSNTFFLERKYILNLKISFKKTYKNDKIMSFNLLLIIISWWDFQDKNKRQKYIWEYHQSQSYLWYIKSLKRKIFLWECFLKNEKYGFWLFLLDLHKS